MDWQVDIERDAIAIYREAKQEPNRPVSLLRLVRELLHTEVQRPSMGHNHESDTGMARK